MLDFTQLSRLIHIIATVETSANWFLGGYVGIFNWFFWSFNIIWLIATTFEPRSRGRSSA